MTLHKLTNIEMWCLMIDEQDFRSGITHLQPLSDRDKLVVERGDSRYDAQIKMHRRDAHMGRGDIPLMRYDLPVDEARLEWLVGKARFIWAAAMYDHEMRHKIDMAARLRPEDYDLSYGMTPEEIEATWHHRPNDPYSRKAGGRPNDPPQGPLYEVFLLVRYWWPRKRFRPTYGPRREDFNAAGRLFLDIAQGIDARYTTKDCTSVYEKWRVRYKK